jgi:lipopolysaccharide biosynthesis regulator YciM
VKFKLAFVLIFISASSGPLFGQVSNDSTAQKSAAVLSEERVDGVLALTGYLGKKLANEFSNRLNLQQNTPSTALKPVKVIIRIGPFRVERTETR